MSDWRLRRAEAGDAAACALVASATFLEAFAGRLSGADIVAHCAANNSSAKFASWIVDRDHVVTLGEHVDGTAPLGYSVLCPSDLPIAAGASDIELKRIYTLTRSLGSGLGKALLDEAITDARAVGKTRMLLGVYAGNDRARCFYEREGFAVAGTRQFVIGESVNNDFIYARDL